MAARGVKLWVLAELDNVRLAVKRLFAGRAAETLLPEELPAKDS